MEYIDKEKVMQALGEPLKHKDFHHGKAERCTRCSGCKKVDIINRYRELVINRLQD